MSPLVRMAWRNVIKNWRHSLAAMLSIAAGIVALGLFEGYMADLRARYAEGMSSRSMLGDLLVEKAGAATLAREDPWRTMLGPGEQEVVDGYLAAHGAEVAARVRFLALNGMVTNGRTTAIFLGYGLDAAEAAAIRRPHWEWNAVAGRPLEQGGPDAVMLGRTLGRILECTPAAGAASGKRPDGTLVPEERPLACRRGRLQLTATTEGGQANAVEPEVTGIVDAGFQELDARYVLLPLPLAQSLLDTQAVSMYAVKLRRPEDAAAFARGLVAAARAHGVALDARPWQEHRLGAHYRQSLQLLGIFRTFVTLVVVIVAVMSVLNTLVKTVSERTREIGTLRSLGFLRRHIVTLFALEGGLLAVLASVIGVLVTLGLAWVANHAGITYKGGLLSEPVPLTIAHVPRVYAVAAVALCGIAVLAAILPARRASRMGIPDALAHV